MPFYVQVHKHRIMVIYSRYAEIFWVFIYKSVYSFYKIVVFKNSPLNMIEILDIYRSMVLFIIFYALGPGHLHPVLRKPFFTFPG